MFLNPDPSPSGIPRVTTVYRTGDGTAWPVLPASDARWTGSIPHWLRPLID